MNAKWTTHLDKSSKIQNQKEFTLRYERVCKKYCVLMYILTEVYVVSKLIYYNELIDH